MVQVLKRTMKEGRLYSFEIEREKMKGRTSRVPIRVMDYNSLVITPSPLVVPSLKRSF